MPKIAKEMTDVEVRRLKPGTIKKDTAKSNKGDPCTAYHAVGGVQGLQLRVRPSGARTWILRVKVGDKRRDYGLGNYPSVTLAQARENAREYRQMIFDGLDPATERRKRQDALRAEQETRITFAEAWQQFWRDKRAGLAEKTARLWEGTITRYALPGLGDMMVADIELRHVEAVLRPIWSDKTETATKLRGRLESIFSWATVKGLRSGDNPARWANGLKEIMPAPSKVTKAGNFRALSIDETPEFLEALRAENGNAARALELAILTAVRSGEVRGAAWSEIDLKAGTWTIPGDRMKMDRDHTVPLSDAAVSLLKDQPKDSELVFPAPRGGMYSDMSLLAVIKRMGWKEKTTAHGFRAVFKSWAVERTDSPDFVSEMALAHSVGDAIQKAYQRSDLLAKRRRLMREWSQFLGYQEKGAKVVSLG